MGRQVNFFLSRDDQLHFEESVFAGMGAGMAMSSSRSPVPNLIETSVIKNFGEDELQIVLFRRDDMAGQRILQTENSIYYYFDILKSRCVEFSRSFDGGEYIRSGRLYYCEKFFATDGSVKKKDEEFLIWAREILERAKKNLRRLPRSRYYCGPNAYARWQAGTLLETDGGKAFRPQDGEYFLNSLG